MIALFIFLIVLLLVAAVSTGLGELLGLPRWAVWIIAIVVFLGALGYIR